MKLFILTFNHPEEDEILHRIVAAENIPEAIDAIWCNTEEGHWLVENGMVALSDMMGESFELPYNNEDSVRSFIDYYENEVINFKVIKATENPLTLENILEIFREDYVRAESDPHDSEDAIEMVLDYYEIKYKHINFRETVEYKENRSQVLKRPYYKNIDKIQQYIGIRYTKDNIQDVIDVLFDNGLHPWNLILVPKPETNLEFAEIINTFAGELHAKWGYEIHNSHSLDSDASWDILWGILQHLNT